MSLLRQIKTESFFSFHTEVGLLLSAFAQT